MINLIIAYVSNKKQTSKNLQKNFIFISLTFHKLKQGVLTLKIYKKNFFIFTLLTFSQTKTRKPYYGGFISIGSVGKSGPHPLKPLGLVYNLDNSKVSDYSESSEKVYMPENLVGGRLVILFRLFSRGRIVRKFVQFRLFRIFSRGPIVRLFILFSQG
jgi:hypothetical protein